MKVADSVRFLNYYYRMTTVHSAYVDTYSNMESLVIADYAPGGLTTYICDWFPNLIESLRDDYTTTLCCSNCLR